MRGVTSAAGMNAELPESGLAALLDEDLYLFLIVGADHPRQLVVPNLALVSKGTDVGINSPEHDAHDALAMDEGVAEPVVLTVAISPLYILPSEIGTALKTHTKIRPCLVGDQPQ